MADSDCDLHTQSSGVNMYMYSAVPPAGDGIRFRVGTPKMVDKVVSPFLAYQKK